ncbi:MAG: iron-sulfur cluster assembly accessory protein [Gemmatimonadetes bacterium]|nr:MAG: iron-sulfur cluster assembly accessory protein [Gemmatimonadota bacterium]
MAGLTQEKPALQCPVTLTPQAIQQIKKIIAEENDPNQVLRMGVKGGGCSGLSYVLQLDDYHPEYDQRFEVDGIPIVIDSKSILYIAGMTLDYSTEMLGGGFRFDNPNATKSCGCGTSFAV